MTARKTLVSETNRMLREALRVGVLDERAHAGLIQALRMQARRIDRVDPDKVDSVSMPVYLRYCERMNLVPSPERPVVASGSGTPKGKAAGDGGDGDGKGRDELADARRAARRRGA